MSDARPPSILSIQSHVVFGHVGNSAAAFAMQRLGCEVMPIHTVQFSSHAGYPGWRGEVFRPALIDELMVGLCSRGALAQCDAALTGYVGAVEVGLAMQRAVATLRAANPKALYCCDPVIGDVGRGVYVREGIAEFMRERAVPAADILTPNHFELDLLSGQASTSLIEARAALHGLHARGPKLIMVTSLILADTPPNALDVLLSVGGAMWRVRTPRLPIAVSGAGDLLAALFVAHLLRDAAPPQALALAASSVYGVIAATTRAKAGEMALIAAQDELVKPSRLFAPESV
jgi:pyridoxine kinase